MINIDRSSPEHRRHPRARNFYLIIFAHPSAGIMMGRTLDISLNGMRIETCDPVPAVSSTTFEVIMDDRILRVRGDAVYSKEISKGIYVTGIAFDRRRPHLAGVTTKNRPLPAPVN